MNKLKEIANSVNQFMNEKFSRGSNARFIFFSVLSILLVSTLLWGSTYSLFVSSNIDNDLNVYKTGNLDITYTLSSENVTFEGNTPVSEEDSVSIKPYRITVTNNGNVPYKFNVILNNNTATNSISSNYLMTQVGKLDPIKLSSCTNNILRSGIVVLAGKSVIIDVRVWLSEDTPNTEIGKSFFGSLTIDGIAVYNSNTELNNDIYIANYEVNASKYIMSLYNSEEATTVHIGGDSSKPEVSLDSTSSIMLDNNGEYRYYGSNPNNYVEYNDELWRIISVSNVKSSEEDTEGETRVRIIRDESIGNHYWNYDSTNNWEEATLNTTLNGIYYNSTSGDCYGDNSTCDYASGSIKGLSEESRNLIDDAVWYLGGNDTSSGLYANDFYTFERGTIVSTEGYPTSTVAKLGIMYPSDYAYATDLSVCTKPAGYAYDSSTSSLVDYSSDTTNCTGTDWLFNSSNQWLLSPNSVSSYYAFCVASSGNINGGSVYDDLYGARPVAVLSSDVVITGGKGTSEEPYQISLEGASNSNLWDEPINAASYVKSLYDDASEDKITTEYISGEQYDDNGDENPMVSLYSDKKIMLDNNGEYRYYGKNPNNYVSFNGELWRIISSSNVKSSEEDTVGNQRIRIIRSESIGYHAWDQDTDDTGTDTSTNNWETSTLNTTLNGIYYNGTSGTCYAGGSAGDIGTATTCDYASGTIKGLSEEARSLIDDAVWYLGGNDTSDGLYANDFYTFERGTTVYEGNPTSTTAKLGIMYPSDYTYAADLSVCTKDGYYYSSDETNCLNTDWLFNGDYQWLISPDSGNSYLAFRVNETGYVSYYNDDYGDVYHVLGVRPLTVLKPNVEIIGGSGTSGDPYILALSE